MNNSKKRIIGDCAAAAVVGAIIMVISMAVPYLGEIGFLFCGTPIAYIIFKYNRNVGIVTAIASAGTVFLITGQIYITFFTAILFFLPSIVFAAIYKVKASGGFYLTLFLVSVIYLMFFVFSVYVLNDGGNGIRNMLTTSSQGVEDMFKNSISMMNGVDSAVLEKAISDAISMAMEMILKYMPTILICTSVLSAYVLIAFNIFVLKRMGRFDIKYPPFCSFMGSRQMCFVTVSAYIVTLCSDDKSIVGITASNTAAVLTAAFSVFGLSTIDWFFKNKVGSGYARAGVYIGVIIIGFPFCSILAEIAAFIGFIDALNSLRAYFVFIRKVQNSQKNTDMNELKKIIKNQWEQPDADNSDKNLGDNKDIDLADKKSNDNQDDERR